VDTFLFAPHGRKIKKVFTGKENVFKIMDLEAALSKENP
jgi:hypothetical protein